MDNATVDDVTVKKDGQGKSASIHGLAPCQLTRVLKDAREAPIYLALEEVGGIL